MNPHVWWYLARAGGLVAYALLAASTAWGLAVSTRLLGRWPAPGWTLDLHRFLGGLALAFTGIHLAGLLLDGYVQFDLLDLLVPFAATWRPGAVAAGVVALYLLLAVELTSLAPRHLPIGSGGGSTSAPSRCLQPPPSTCWRLAPTTPLSPWSPYQGPPPAR